MGFEGYYILWCGVFKVIGFLGTQEPYLKVIGLKVIGFLGMGFAGYLVQEYGI